MADFDEVKDLFGCLDESGLRYFVSGGLAVDVIEGLWSGRDSVGFYVFDDDVFSVLDLCKEAGYAGVKCSSGGVLKRKSGFLRRRSGLEARVFSLERLDGSLFKSFGPHSVLNVYPKELFESPNVNYLNKIEFCLARNEVVLYDSSALNLDVVDKETVCACSYDEKLFSRIMSYEDWRNKNKIEEKKRAEQLSAVSSGEQVSVDEGLCAPSVAAKQTIQQRDASIDDLVSGGEVFFSDVKDGSNECIGLGVALGEAYGARSSGRVDVIASLPYLVAGRAKAGKDNYLWGGWFSVLSEEDCGVDRDGVFVGRGEGVVVVVHGGGLLTPKRIMQAYSEGLTLQNAAKFTYDEFDNLLRGVLPSGESVDLYSVDDVKRGISDPFGRFGVWLPAGLAKSRRSGHFSKGDFVGNELVVARVGTLEYVEDYFDKAKCSNGAVGNRHRFGDVDFGQPQGRVLFVVNSCDGLDGYYYLDNYGRFVGV